MLNLLDILDAIIEQALARTRERAVRAFEVPCVVLILRMCGSEETTVVLAYRCEHVVDDAVHNAGA